MENNTEIELEHNKHISICLEFDKESYDLLSKSAANSYRSKKKEALIRLHYDLNNTAYITSSDFNLNRNGKFKSLVINLDYQLNKLLSKVAKHSGRTKKKEASIRVINCLKNIKVIGDKETIKKYE